MKFLIDMPLSPNLVTLLKQKGFESIHTYHSGLAQATDERIIEYARINNYIVITADLDYPRILALTKEENPGIILIRGGNYSELEIQSLIDRVLSNIPSEKLISSIIIADKNRIRRRKLPL